MLFVCLGLSALLLLLANGLAYSREGTAVGRVALFVTAVIAILFWTMTLVLLLNAVAVILIGLICWMTGARPRLFLISSLGVTVAVYALLLVPDLMAWQGSKKSYPIESLTARLAYEDRVGKPTLSAGKVGLAEADNLEFLESLVEQEETGFLGATRTYSLQHLHAGITRQFIDSPGFGVGRKFPRANADLLARSQLGPEEPIAQPVPYAQLQELAPGPARTITARDFLTTHAKNTVDFLNPIGFGYFQDRDHVAGFQPHQFGNGANAPERWRLDRLELVGILKYEEPVVYLSEHLPRMEELRQAPTRTLDSFEKAALEKLFGGEHLIVQETAKQMRMLGSIRATKQCLRCHQGERGALLGAFSYRMAAKEKAAE